MAFSRKIFTLGQKYFTGFIGVWNHPKYQKNTKFQGGQYSKVLISEIMPLKNNRNRAFLNFWTI